MQDATKQAIEQEANIAVQAVIILLLKKYMWLSMCVCVLILQ